MKHSESSTPGMTPPRSGAISTILPEAWQAAAEAQLVPEEIILANLEIDLDAHLQFSPGILILTDRRLLSCTNSHEGHWQSLNLRAGMTLTRHDHAGVGSLELSDAASRVALWRYTLGADIAAGRLIDHFERQVEFLATGIMPRPPAQY